MIRRPLMATYAYARCSTRGQKTDSQLAALRARSPDHLVRETASTRGERPKLAALLGKLQAGDVLVVTRLDRMARSMKELVTLVDDLKTRNIALVVTEQSIDTSTATGALLFGVLAAVAEFERDLRAERCREGIEATKAKGKPLGRKPVLAGERAAHARTLHRDGTSIRDVAKLLGVSKSAVGRLVFDGC